MPGTGRSSPGHPAPDSMRPGSRGAVLTGAGPAAGPPSRPGAGMATTAAALAVTLGLAAASWVVAVRQMSGMDMGVATRLGSFAFFAALWVPMMAAMMLPGAAPAVVRRAQASGLVRAVPPFVGSYLAVWALAGAAVYVLYRPHGSARRRRAGDRGRRLRAHAGQAALPQALPGERPLRILLRAVLRRLERRADG